MKKQTIKNATEVVYHFEDSSVPPKYHRSYTISINENSMNVVVDSYGDILADTTISISKDQYNDILDYAIECNLSNKTRVNKEDDCTGGTSKSLSIYIKDESIINGTLYKCGGQRYGDLDGDIDKFSIYIVSKVPNFSKLVE
ncbi:MAG: hypothetical protein C0596_10050 [Marinilabiliales bacterium]|nr:MAG: hypothetical protein C0596_10050 [Marinilabiliales bacterium]